MSVGLLFDADEHVAAYLFAAYKWPPYKFDSALGLVKDGALVGAVLFHNWNGNNVELSYYGKHTLSLGIIRTLARYAIHTFDPSRVTVITHKKNKKLMRGYQKMGFRFEGTQRCYYGRIDCNRSTGCRFVMFRDRIDQIAALKEATEAA